MEIKNIIILIIGLFYCNVYSQNITLDVSSVKIILKSDFKGSDNYLNGNYIAGQFEINNKSNDTLYLPSLNNYDRWTNNYKTQCFFYKMEIPYLLIDIVENQITNNQTSNFEISDKSEVYEEKITFNEKFSKQKYSGDLLYEYPHIKKLIPNSKYTFYFLKKTNITNTSNVNINISIIYNTLYLNKKVLNKELKKEKKKNCKEKRIGEKKIKKIEQFLSKYSKTVNGRTVYVSNPEVRKNLYARNDITNHYNETKKMITHLEKLIKISPIKLSTKKIKKIRYIE